MQSARCVLPEKACFLDGTILDAFDFARVMDVDRFDNNSGGLVGNQPPAVSGQLPAASCQLPAASEKGRSMSGLWVFLILV